MKELAQYIDHTDLRPEATAADIEKLCDEAKRYGFRTVCVNACRAKVARACLAGSGVGIATVVGFPLGATTTAVKCKEAAEAAQNGATEIDMVINVGAIKESSDSSAREEIRAVIAACGLPVKVILETCKLTKEEIERAARLADEAGAAFVKTSTGFGGGGATVEDVALMKSCVKRAQVKASGGIRDAQTARAMIAAGATRLGTSSGIKIVEG